MQTFSKVLRHLHKITVLGVTCASMVFGSGDVHSQSTSNQPIKIILPTPAGIGPDLWIRRVIPQVSRLLGQTVVLENKPGGNGIIGSSAVLNAAPDGQTLLFTSVAELLAARYLSPASQIYPERFVPITAAIRPQLFLVASPLLPIKSLTQLGNYAQTSKRAPTYGTSGAGSPFHLMGISLAQSSKVDLTHVPYKGTLLAIQDVIGGRIDMGFGSLAGVSQFIEKGQLQPLAVLAQQRNKQFASIPTIFEVVPGIQLPPDWFGLWAPPGTPSAAISKLNRAFVQAINTPENLAWLESNGFEKIASTPETQQQMTREGQAVYNALARSLNLKPE